jgi:hypothetical protein
MDTESQALNETQNTTQKDTQVAKARLVSIRREAMYLTTVRIQRPCYAGHDLNILQLQNATDLAASLLSGHVFGSVRFEEPQT